jgi:hypothetical protein
MLATVLRERGIVGRSKTLSSYTDSGRKGSGSIATAVLGKINL